MFKVLIIEDDQILQKMYTNKLVGNNFEVVNALDGEAGFEKAKEVQPDFILLDLMMPRMDGWGALRKLKAEDNTKNIPVAILSVVPQDAEANPNSELLKDVVAYWRKDQFEPNQLVDMINQFLAKSQKEIN